MEVDHHNAQLPTRTRNNYSNLFLSTRHCNGAKRDRPTSKELGSGLRFLNPCIEGDYGHQIFEDPKTHRLWGITREARYHIIYCDLNANHLLKEREKRTRFQVDLNRGARIKSLSKFADCMKNLRTEIDLMIPEIELRTEPPELAV